MVLGEHVVLISNSDVVINPFRHNLERSEHMVTVVPIPKGGIFGWANKINPQVILLDFNIRIGENDWKEVVSSLKENPVTSSIPIILIAVPPRMNTQKQVERIKKIGVEDVLQDSPDWDKVDQVIQEVTLI